jgi:acetyltransferase-like isoleucine patch superfamily enzyme
MKQIFQQACFVLRDRYFSKYIGQIRNLYYRLQGMKIGKGTYLSKVFVTWPHKVSIGRSCRLEHHIYFHHDGIWSVGYSVEIGDNVFIGSGCEFNITEKVLIGSNSLIASGCRFIDHDHGTKMGELIGTQPAVKKGITLEEDVWLGCNVVVLKGVHIGSGTVVAAGAVVTKSIPPHEIRGGVPARKIGERK